MKHLKFLAVICLAAGTSFAVSSCNSAEEKKADEKPADSSLVKAPDPMAAKPVYLSVMMHKVSNFSKWLKGYEAGDSLRLSHGVHNFVLARGVQDTNMVMVAVKVDDTARASQFMALPDLKAAMQKAGVIGAPTISMLDVQMQDTTTNTSSIRLMVTHKVKDWAAWKGVFDGNQAERTNAGLSDRLLAYHVGDNHAVTIVFLVSDMKKAEDFTKSPGLKARMEAGGVDGPPGLFYYTIAKKY
ncbi:MAG: hypothetical protein IPL84_13500 [Chitinophagaceae bacterium]|nr:hypothetical protein [Chitinophagaceae bacterium]